MLEGLSATFDAFGERLGLPAGRSLEIILARDFVTSVRGFVGRTVGVGDLEDFDVERVGGVVAGKTMFLRTTTLRP